MKNVYFYIIDGLADWEISNILAELNSKRFFKKRCSNNKHRNG